MSRRAQWLACALTLSSRHAASEGSSERQQQSRGDPSIEDLVKNWDPILAKHSDVTSVDMHNHNQHSEARGDRSRNDLIKDWDVILNATAEENERVHNHAKRSEQLQAVVSAWLNPLSKGSEPVVGVGVTADNLALAAAELSVMNKLKPAERPYYDRKGGCIHHAAYAKYCFPSDKIIPRMITSHPGPVVVEYGSFLGEATWALHSAIQGVQSKYGNLSSTRILAMDTWKEHQAFGGIWTFSDTWQPPKDVMAEQTPQPPAYYQFLVNLRRSASVDSRVVPFSLLAPDAVARANGIGMSSPRPKLIYVNPPRHTASLSLDLPTLWRLLACGGTIGGAGYHVLRNEVDAFAASIPGAKLEAYMLHAPGSKYEKEDRFNAEEFYSGAHFGMFHVNFTYWKICNKPCPS